MTMQVSVKSDDLESSPPAAGQGMRSGEAPSEGLSAEAALVPVWVGMLRVQRAVVSELDAELQAKHHLSLSSFEVLLHLSRQPERRMRLTALAESVVLTQSGISRLIDRLEQAGLVRREPFPGDARGAYAALTEEGLAHLRAAEVTHLAMVRAHFLDHLTAAERATLAHVWDRLLSGSAPHKISSVNTGDPGQESDCERVSPEPPSRRRESKASR